MDYYKASQSSKARVVQSMFDQVAPKYDCFNAILSLGLDRIWRKQAIRTLTQNTSTQKPILDLGCGSGDLAGALHPKHSVIGADFCYPMLKEAQQKFSGLPLLQADATTLPLQNQSISGAISAFVIRNIEGLENAFHEVSRCLIPGGRFVILEFSLPKNPIMRFGFFTYLKIMFPIACTLFKGDQEAYQYLRKSIRSFGENVDVKHYLSKANFQNIQSKPLLGGGVTLYQAVKP